MIELMSIGGRLRPGQYQAHIRFARAISFRCDVRMAYIVDSAIGAGPLNIVVSGFDYEETKVLKIGKKCIWIDDSKIDSRCVPRYSSYVNVPVPFDIERMIENLYTFEELVRFMAPPKSLISMLDNNRINNFETKFEMMLLNELMYAGHSLAKGDYIRVAKSAKGRGYGLTPSGDDFIAGTLSALYIVDRIISANHHRIKMLAYRHALGDNYISNSFLRCARNGWFTDRQKNFIFEILDPYATKIFERTKDLLDAGETSGADWATGFLMTMKKELKLDESGNIYTQYF
jgi:hypothetical protein